MEGEKSTTTGLELGFNRSTAPAQVQRARKALNPMTILQDQDLDSGPPVVRIRKSPVASLDQDRVRGSVTGEERKRLFVRGSPGVRRSFKPRGKERKVVSTGKVGRRAAVKELLPWDMEEGGDLANLAGENTAKMPRHRVYTTELAEDQVRDKGPGANADGREVTRRVCLGKPPKSRFWVGEAEGPGAVRRGGGSAAAHRRWGIHTKGAPSSRGLARGRFPVANRKASRAAVDIERKGGTPDFPFLGQGGPVREETVQRHLPARVRPRAGVAPAASVAAVPLAQGLRARPPVEVAEAQGARESSLGGGPGGMARPAVVCLDGPHSQGVNAELSEERPRSGGGTFEKVNPRLRDAAGGMNRSPKEEQLKGFDPTHESFGESPAPRAPEEGGAHGSVKAPEAVPEGNAGAGQLGPAGKKVSLGGSDAVFDRARRGGRLIDLDPKDRHLRDAGNKERRSLPVQDREALAAAGGSVAKSGLIGQDAQTARLPGQVAISKRIAEVLGHAGGVFDRARHAEGVGRPDLVRDGIAAVPKVEAEALFAPTAHGLPENIIENDVPEQRGGRAALFAALPKVDPRDTNVLETDVQGDIRELTQNSGAQREGNSLVHQGAVEEAVLDIIEGFLHVAFDDGQRDPPLVRLLKEEPQGFSDLSGLFPGEKAVHVTHKRREASPDGLNHARHVPLLEGTDETKAAPMSRAACSPGFRDALHQELAPGRKRAGVARGSVKPIFEGRTDRIEGPPREVGEHLVDEQVPAGGFVGSHAVTGVQQGVHRQGDPLMGRRRMLG